MKKSSKKIPKYFRVKATNSEYLEHAKVLEKIVNWDFHRRLPDSFKEMISKIVFESQK